MEALERFRGNKRAVARHLEIDPKTLYRLLKKHGIFAGAVTDPGLRVARDGSARSISGCGARPAASCSPGWWPR